MTENIEVKSFPITLAQFLKFCGLAYTGGEAKEIVREGYVEVNGEVCTMPGKKLQPEDKVTFDTEDGEVNYILKTAE